MKCAFPKIVLLLLTLMSLSVVGQADTVTYNLYLKDSTQTTATIAPGATVDFWVVMVTDPTDSVANVGYDVLLPIDNWELTSRDMDAYGWWEADGLWDNSVPTAAGTPATVTNALYSVTLTDPDFHTDTIRYDFNGVSGTVTVEDFRLTVPAYTALGDYTISLLNSFAHDEIGNPITAGVGDDFTLGVVPEPTTIALFGLGLLGLADRLRRHRFL